MKTIQFITTLWVSTAIFLSFAISPFVILILWLLLQPILLLYPDVEYKFYGYTFRYITYLLVVKFNPFWKVTITQALPDGYHPESTIIMCNHLSSVDPWILLHIFKNWETKWIFKASLLKLPFVSLIVAFSGDIALKFSSEGGGWNLEKGAKEHLFQGVKRSLRHKTPVVVFPEGTRSRTGGLQPFKPGFFKFVVENQLKILPICLHNCQSIWPLRSQIVQPGEVFMAAGKPISSDGETVDSLRTKTWEAIHTIQKQFPLYDPIKEKPVLAVNATRGQGL